MTEFKIPELGENVASGDVTRVLVNVGDTIAREQPVLELETDKATIEVPSSVAGVVKEIKVKAGEAVEGGQPFSTSTSVLPTRAGDGDTLMPADSIAAIFDSASPLPPVGPSAQALLIWKDLSRGWGRACSRSGPVDDGHPDIRGSAGPLPHDSESSPRCLGLAARVGIA